MEQYKLIILIINLIVNTSANSTSKQPPEDFEWNFHRKSLFPYGTDVGDFPLSHLQKIPYATYSYNTGDDVVNLHGGKIHRLSIMDYLPLVTLSTFGRSMILNQDRCARIAPYTYLFCRGGIMLNCQIVSDILPRIPENLGAQEYQALGVRGNDKKEKVTTFVRKTRDREILREIAEDIVKTYPDEFSGRVSLEWALIITWKDVQFFREPFQGNGANVTVSPRSTYQVALTSTSDGDLSFAVVNHEKIDWNFEEIRENVQFERSIDRLKKELMKNCKDSNLNKTGVSGRFVYRLDNALAFTENDEQFTCPLRKNHNEEKNITERVRIFPHIINILDASYISLEMEIDGNCFWGLNTEDWMVDCSLRDTAGNIQNLTTFQEFRSKKEKSVITTCTGASNARAFRSLGRQTLTLKLMSYKTGAVHTFYGYVYVVQFPPEVFQVTVDHDKNELSMTWDTNTFNNTALWSRSYKSDVDIKELPPVSSLFVDMGFYMLDETDMTFKGRDVCFARFANKVRYTEGNLSCLTSTMFERQDKLIVATLRDAERQVELFSPVRRIGRKVEDTVVACLRFIYSSNQKLNFPNDTEVCPPTKEFARKDPRFQLLSGHLNNSFRQVVPAPSGAASVCSYNDTNGNLVLAYPAGAASLRFHPAYDYWKHKLQDEIPKELCCSDANNKEICRAFYKKRPSKDSTGYVIPRAARAVGAGHITTFDDAKLTLKDIGEFLLMDYKSPKLDGISLKVQVRMEQYLSFRGTKRKASVFTAFAMEESRAAAGETIRIQVEDKGVGSGIHVMLDGEPLQVDFNQILGTEKRFILRWKSVLLRKSLEGDEVEVTLASGFTFRFNTVSPKEMGLNLMVTGSCLRDNVRFSHEDIDMNGLLGDCDHNPENDFSVTASEQDKTLGLPWKILSREDSIFTYDGDGKSFDSYNKAAPYKSDFNLTDAIHSDHDGNLGFICGNQEDCVYDLQTTDSVPLAQATKASNDEFEKLRMFYQYATGICSNGKKETFSRGWTKNAYDLVKYLPEGKRLERKCFPGYKMKNESADSELSCNCNEEGKWKCIVKDGGGSCIQVEMKEEEIATEITPENLTELSV